MNNKYSPEYRTQRKWTIWIFVALLGALLLNSLAGDYFKRTFFTLVTALTPVLIGFIFTFLLKKMLDFLQQKVFKKWFTKLKNGEKVNRMFCIFLLFAGIFFIIYLVLAILVPNVVSFVNEINSNLNNFVNNIKVQLTEFFKSTGWFNDVDVENMITDFINRIGDTLLTNIPLIADSISSLIQQTATVLMYVLMGVIISIIMLYRKEDIAAFSKRLTYATFSKKKADKIVKTVRMSDKVLYDYVGAKALDAFIVFLIMLPGFYIFKVPYPVLMALVMAIINIIPYIGSVIATIIIAIFTISMVGVNMAIWTIVYIMVVLNVYGNLFGPFIFGKRMKVSSLLIIVSMLVFGSIFGFWGLIIGPPIMVILWSLLNDFIAERENEQIELEKYDLTTEDINDLEILQEATKIVKERRKKQQEKSQKTKQMAEKPAVIEVSAEVVDDKAEKPSKKQQKKSSNE